MSETPNPKRVCVVEDDKNLNRLIAYNLTMNGFNVETIHDGDEAKEILALKRFDAVILDLMLPGADGFRICESVKSNPETNKTPVVMVTARSQPLDIINGRTMGADRYITKPFSMAELIGVINELTM